MGDWSSQPWGNDEAADWFHCFWTKGRVSFLIDEIKKFDEKEERYDSIRSAAYLLQTLGIAHVWPSEYMDELKPTLVCTISILENMINPPNDDWGFLDMYGNSPDIVNAVNAQISELRIRLEDLV